MTIKTVPLRKLGSNGPTVPALGFGLMGLGGCYGAVPSDEDRFRVLDRALEIGATYWDSANIYGDNEIMLGDWFQRTGKRDEIFLSSKFGIIMDVESFAFKGINSSAKSCRNACEESLKKMGIDHIDLYYAHRLDLNTPIEETMRELAKLQKEGKIRHIGLSAVSSTTLRRAFKIAPVAAVQMEYSLFALDIEGEAGTNLLTTCRELGVAVVCYSPLGRGLLTGALGGRESLNGNGGQDIRSKDHARFSEENLEANRKIISQFKLLADTKRCTTSQLAIAWILKQGNDFLPIPGTKNIKKLEENWAALEVHLTDEEEGEIRKFAQGHELSGTQESVVGRIYAFADTRDEI